MGNTFITNIEPMKEVLNNTENNLSCFLDISDEIVTKYSEDLDNLLNDIKKHTINNECSDDQIERYILELSNMLYFVGQKLEIVGIRDDLSSLMAKEVYNNSYINNSLNTDNNKKATVAELNVKAEEASRYQTVLNKIYSRTYKQLKCKIEDFDSYCDFRRDQFEKEEDERIKAKINEILNEVTKHINMLNEDSDKFFEDSKLV